MNQLLIIKIKLFLLNNNIIGLKSIYYCLFLFLTFNIKLFRDIPSNNIIDIQNYIKKTFNIFNKLIILDNISLSNILKLIDSIDSIDLNIDTLINNIFEIYLTNENLLDIKDYIKYYNNKLLTDWISNLPNNNNNNKNIFDGNIKINSYSDLFKMDNNFGLQTNEYIYIIILIQNFIKNNNFKINNIINKNILLDFIKLNNSLFDIIFFDFPSNIHNIIYTQCCDQIKNLKIRGTNSDCLLLQQVSLSLNIGGSAVIIMPESILYGKSKQIIETRKYIFNNFDINKIVHIDQNIYYNNINRDLKSITNAMKNCIFYFKNIGKTTTINISKIILNENKIVETPLIIINNINEEYSFYYKDYLNKNKLLNKNELNFKIASDIFNFDNNILNNQSFIILNKYYNNKNFIKISNLETDIDHNNNYLIYEKEKNNNLYFIYYLENIIKKNPEDFINKLTNHFELSKISEYKIPILSLDKQTNLCNYISITEKIKICTQENINRFIQLKNSILDNIPTTSMIKLDNIIDLVQEKQTDKKLITILRNSILAGSVNLYDGGLLNNNTYYLISKDNNNFILLYIYYYLKHIESFIKENSNLTQQSNLIKSNLLNIKIPNINIDAQSEIIKSCEMFDNNINLLILNNKTIIDKNIFDIITTINSY